MNFPSFVNFRMLSCAAVPAIHTKPCRSTSTVCSAVGQRGWYPGPPHAWTTLPSWSISMTSGPRMQQSISPFVPPISSGLAFAARLRNHTWSSGDILMPVTCCILHRLGKGFGQNGSTLYIGAPLASRACICRCCERATETMARTTTQHNTNAAAFTRLERFFVFMEIFPFLQSSGEIQGADLIYCTDFLRSHGYPHLQLRYKIPTKHAGGVYEEVFVRPRCGSGLCDYRRGSRSGCADFAVVARRQWKSPCGHGMHDMPRGQHDYGCRPYCRGLETPGGTHGLGRRRSPAEPDGYGKRLPGKELS